VASTLAQTEVQEGCLPLLFLARLLALAAPARDGQSLNYVASRGLVGAGVDLLFLAVSPRGPKADSSLIHLCTSAMGQQVTKDIRSRLEYCTLEELLTDDKVIS
jgi:hypothetical protein